MENLLNEINVQPLTAKLNFYDDIYGDDDDDERIIIFIPHHTFK